MVGSDGVWNFVEPQRKVASIVRDASSPKAAAEEIIKEAKRSEYATQLDNITVAVIPVKEQGPSVVGIWNPASGKTRFTRG